MTNLISKSLLKLVGDPIVLVLMMGMDLMMDYNRVRFVIFSESINMQVQVDFGGMCIRNYRVGLSVLHVNFRVEDSGELYRRYNGINFVDLAHSRKCGEELI